MKPARRRRIVLISLVTTSLLLFTAYYGESIGGPFHTVQRGVRVVLSPVESGVSRALKPVRDLINWVDDTLNAKKERDRLRKEREALLEEAAAAEQARRENRNLRALLSLNRELELARYSPVTVRVIARSPTVWYSTVTVNKGSSSGIKIDQPVIGGGGLVGRVSDVTSGTAQITLIADESSAVSSIIPASDTAGVVRPTVGNPDDLLLDFVTPRKQIRKGQRVVTAGTRSKRLESLFPPGIPIGRVSKVDGEEVDRYQRVHIEPYADLEGFDFVQVLRQPSSEN